MWHDEFEGTEVDTAKWRVENDAPAKNAELEYYSPDEVYIENGCLVLRSQERIMGGRNYTSGSVDTAKRFSVRYGRIEIRAKLPKGQGIWPAHWLLPDDWSWPPEIDIMELLGRDTRTVYMTYHSKVMGEHITEGGQFNGPDFSEDFHTFALEWKPNDIRWYVDGVERFHVYKHVSHQPMMIILNTAVGGYMPGNPDATTPFPQYHLIDYVRVYEKEGAAYPD